MKIAGFIAAALLCLSLALTGISAQASVKQPCPMMQMQNTGMKDCDCCDKTTGQKQEHQQKKSGCGGGMACGAQCLSMSSATMTLPETQNMAFALGNAEKLLFTSDRLLASPLRNPQERPPKYLS